MDNEEYEYAGFWIRVGATLIDTLLLSMVTVLLMLWVYGSLVYESEDIFLGPADFLINVVFPLSGTILFWLYKSATPGKMALGLKIVNADDGGKLTVGQCIGRYFAYIPAIFVLFIGILWVAFDEKKQGWHDKLAKTVVIKKNKSKI
jgi:uncharacterized RDD family membrane protein YckC